MIQVCKRTLLINKSDEKPDPSVLLHEIYEINVDFQKVWLQRNRSSGWMDNLSRFNVLLDEHQGAYE